MWPVSPALAQTTEAISAAANAGSLLIGQGPLSALFVVGLLACAVVIVVLWKAMNAKDKIIAELNEARAKSAAALEAALVANKAAIDAFSKVVEASGSANDDILDAVKAVGQQQAQLAQLLAMNGEGIKYISTELLREILNSRRPA